MSVIQSYLTNNDCYKSGIVITVKGLMLHSVGCPQPSAQAFVKSWNTSKPGGRSVCVHGFIDANSGDVYQTLPWDYKAWHGGGSSNNTHIGVEMCEPASFSYTGGATFRCSDPEGAKASVSMMYNSAVQLFASLCKQFNLDPLAPGVIVSHREGSSLGIASNHGDPEHMWSQLGLPYTMDTFRSDVASVLSGGSVQTLPDGVSGGTPTVSDTGMAGYTGNSAYNYDNIGGISGAIVAIESKPDFTGMQPLFPFVELHIGNQCVTCFLDDFSDTLIDFTYHRTSHYTDSSQTGSKFDITLYDDTALEVEDLLAGNLVENSGIEVSIRYGYSKSNDERYMTSTLNGTVVKYGLSFEGIGLTLTLSGTIRNFSVAMGEVKTEEYSGEEYQGIPSDIVKYICEKEGWEIGYIEETEPILNNDGSPETFRQENESTLVFINRKLCERSVSAETGDVGYIAYFGEDGKFYFISSTNTSIDVKVASDEQLAALTLPKEE